MEPEVDGRLHGSPRHGRRDKLRRGLQRGISREKRVNLNWLKFENVARSFFAMKISPSLNDFQPSSAKRIGIFSINLAGAPHLSRLDRLNLTLMGLLCPIRCSLTFRRLVNEAFISGSGRMFMHLWRKCGRSVTCKRDVEGKVRMISN